MTEKNDKPKKDGSGIIKHPQDARGAEIVLKQPRERWSILIGVTLAVVFAFLLAFQIAV